MNYDIYYLLFTHTVKEIYTYLVNYNILFIIQYLHTLIKEHQFAGRIGNDFGCFYRTAASKWLRTYASSAR